MRGRSNGRKYNIFIIIMVSKKSMKFFIPHYQSVNWLNFYISVKLINIINHQWGKFSKNCLNWNQPEAVTVSCYRNVIWKLLTAAGTTLLFIYLTWEKWDVGQMVVRHHSLSCSSAGCESFKNRLLTIPAQAVWPGRCSELWPGWLWGGDGVCEIPHPPVQLSQRGLRLPRTDHGVWVLAAGQLPSPALWLVLWRLHGLQEELHPRLDPRHGLRLLRGVKLLPRLVE